MFESNIKGIKVGNKLFIHILNDNLILSIISNELINIKVIKKQNKNIYVIFLIIKYIL